MSFRWAISLIRVSGTKAENSDLNEGKLGMHFAMKDLVDLHFFLGIKAKCISTALVFT